MKSSRSHSSNNNASSLPLTGEQGGMKSQQTLEKTPKQLRTG